MSEFIDLEVEEPEGPVGEVLESANDKLIRAKIVHILGIYTKLSPSMLQVGVGTNLQPRVWKPILTRMFEDGTLKLESMSSESPGGRSQVYTIISLA